MELFLTFIKSLDRRFSVQVIWGKLLNLKIILPTHLGPFVQVDLLAAAWCHSVEDRDSISFALDFR